ncbi:MAG: AAA family ATPase, partial [Tannerella sp.]|nr:AAA family ATPase [Tannerella sp.]
MDNKKQRELPLGIQDFETLRTNKFIYVDKTQYVYQLASVVRPYFLGRPRRFGKSLLLSTLRDYFLGKKELFEGLAIADLEKDWTVYPVIYIDLNKESYTSISKLEAVLNHILSIHEEIWGRKENDTTIALRFENLIRRAGAETKQKVVVLIDEYDKPLVNTLDDEKLNDAMRDLLKGFYGVLKSNSANIRFVMLTGVTKFSKLGIFSDLNFLIDISMNKDYAAICGITEEELIQNFKPEIQTLGKENEMTFEAALAEMKKRYDGYHFADRSPDIYNPYSVLNTLLKRHFGYYWFETGTPTFLVKMIKQRRLDVRKFEADDVRVSAKDIFDYRVELSDPVPILYQAGYLTIKSYKKLTDTYVLGYPNEEV